MALEVPQYPAHPLHLLSKHQPHRLVRLEVRLELFVLQLVLLDVRVQLLDHLAPGQPLALPGADDLGEVGGDVQLGVGVPFVLWAGISSDFHLKVGQCGTTLSVSEKSGAGAQCAACAIKCRNARRLVGLPLRPFPSPPTLFPIPSKPLSPDHC